MGSLLIVVSTPSLAFSPRIVEAHEPTRVQTFRSEITIERLDEGIVSGLARSREVERDTAPVNRRDRDRVRFLDRTGLPSGNRLPPTSSRISTTSGPRKLSRGSIAGEKRENV